MSKTKRYTTSDEKRLIRAGWQRRKHGWKSPYTGAVLNEERAVRVELIMDPKPPGPAMPL